MIEKIKELRIQIDGLAQLTKELIGDPPINEDKILFGKDFKGFPTEETKKATDSLLLAKAWLGKVLGELGSKNPYKSGYKTKEDIEPTADVNQDIHGYNLDVVHFEDKNHIEKVDWLRSEIQKIIDETGEFLAKANIENPLLLNSINAIGSIVLQHICEARFWLGFELQRIKEQKNDR